MKLVEYLSVFFAQSAHVCTNLCIFIGQVIHHSIKSLNLILLLPLDVYESIHFQLHLIVIVDKSLVSSLVYNYVLTTLPRLFRLKMAVRLVHG